MYRKLGRTSKHRRSMLANLTKDLIMNEKIETTETRAKEVRTYFDKMVTYEKKLELILIKWLLMEKMAHLYHVEKH